MCLCGISSVCVVYVSVHMCMCVVTCEYGVLLCGVSICVCVWYIRVCVYMLIWYLLLVLIQVLILVCVCLCTYKDKRRMSGVLLHFSLNYSFETGSLTKPRARLASTKPQPPSFLVLYNTGIMGMCVHLYLPFYMGAEVLLFTQ